MKDKTKRLRINWYKVIYQTKDEGLMSEFWKFFKCHRISKNRAARAVLLHYYSTTRKVPPICVTEAFSFNQNRKFAQFNAYDDSVIIEDLSL